MRIYQLNQSDAGLNEGKEKPKKHNLEIRIEELTTLLSKNNQEFSKGLPSEEQLKNILTHSYNCYDQLDFISLEYSRNQSSFWQPKVIAENMHKISRVTKYFCNNIKNWLQNYSVELVKRTYEANLKTQNQNPFGSTCKICQNRTEEIFLKETRKQIMGPNDWRQLFDEELMMQQKEDNCYIENNSDREYASSVNYLSKVIREMQASVQSYEKLNEKIEHDKQIQDHPALKILQDVLGNLRLKLGEKYKSKEKEIFDKLFKQSLSNRKKQNKGENMNVSQQFDLIIGLPPKKQRAKRVTQQPVPENIVQKLQQENKRLLIERNSINQLYSSTQSVLNELTGFKNKKNSNFSKQNTRNSTLNQDSKEGNASFQDEIRSKNLATENESEQRIIYRERYRQTGLVQPPPLSIKKSMKESTIKRISLFNMQRIESRKEELSQMFGKGASDVERSEYDWNQYFSQIQQKNRIYFDERAEMIDAACQWQDLIVGNEEEKRKSTAKSSRNHEVYEIKQSQFSDDESEDLKSKSRNHKKKKSSLSSSRSLNSRNQHRGDLHKKQKENHIINIKDMKRPKKMKTEGTQDRENHNMSYDTLKNSNKQERKSTNKLTNKDSSLHLHQNLKQNKVTFNKKIQKLGKIEERNSKVNVSLGKIQDKSIVSQVNFGKEGKERHTLGTFVRNIRMEVEEQEKASTTLSKFDRHRDPSQKGSKKDLAKHKMMTEGNDKVYFKKSKNVTNFLFKPQHLTLFGGVSESFSYQNDKTALNEDFFDQFEKKKLQRMVAYFINLKGFKRSIYENVIHFLSHPFETIEKPEFEFKPVSNEKLKKIVMKLLFFHKKRCNSLTCEHISMFSDLIGYSLC